MTDKAAIAGSYSDFKLVKSRSVAQIVIEVPIEKAEAFLSAFGVPQPGAERPVALALLNVENPAEKPRQSFNEMSRAQQAGILCADKGFQEWLGVRPQAGADDIVADYVRTHCGVDSRSKLDSNQNASYKWDTMVSRYRQATGQETWHP